MSSEPPISRESAAVLLRQSISKIILNWEKRAKAEVPAAQVHDHLSLLDALPVFLDQLSVTLLVPHSRVQAEINASVATEHAEERASLGNYTLDQFIYEYQVLREELVSFLERTGTLSVESLQIIHAFLDRGIRKSAARFKEIAETKQLSTIRSQEVLVKKLKEERDLREIFVSALSHDLRTPLTAAKLSAQLLRRKAEDPESVKSLADRIVGCINRSNQMINDLLDANRINAGDGIPIMMTECRLDEILESILKEFNTLHGSRFIFENEAGETRGQWDAGALRRVFENIIDNAIKYGEAKTPIHVKLVKTSDWVEISVHNQGSPILLEDQKTLFDPFRRTESALKGGQNGWGIGLTLVKGITEAHRGSVRVESRPGLGTTFFVRLPVEPTIN